MKSYEEHLSEACPAIIAWHKLVWEESLSDTPVETPPTEDETLIEEIITEPTIKEWRTIRGKRKINNDFAKNMTVGY